MQMSRRMLCVTFWVIAALCVGCEGGEKQKLNQHPVQTGGSAYHGKQIIVAYHCGQCHTIPGISGANGVVGPPLVAIARRTYIGGNIPKTPENLEHWVMSPKSLKPGTAMPDLGLSHEQARDVAAYLYTLK